MVLLKKTSGNEAIKNIVLIKNIEISKKIKLKKKAILNSPKFEFQDW